MWNNICLLARLKLLLSDYVIVEGEKVSYYSNLGASTWPAVFRRTRGSSGDAFDVFRWGHRPKQNRTLQNQISENHLTNICS